MKSRSLCQLGKTLFCSLIINMDGTGCSVLVCQPFPPPEEQFFFILTFSKMPPVFFCVDFELQFGGEGAQGAAQQARNPSLFKVMSLLSLQKEEN